MREFVKIFTPLILIILYVIYTAFFFGRLEPAEGYPLWLIDDNENHTDQTSGLTFIGIKDGKKNFVSCDDIGKIHRILVDESESSPDLKISEITLSERVKEYLKPFDKWDFEDIQTDPVNNELYITIEGSGSRKPDPMGFRKSEGIFRMEYNNDIFNTTEITNITKVDFPGDVFEHTRSNIGFEGLAISDNYFFLGLENVRFNDKFFTDSTVIYICDKSTKAIVNRIYTSKYEIITICGLYAVSDRQLLGIDRNMRRIFMIDFNPDMTVKNVRLKELNMYVPGYPFLNQIVGIAPESVTMDNTGNFYITIDPWREMYKVIESNKKSVDGGTLDKLTSFMPILFKYKSPF